MFFLLFLIDQIDVLVQLPKNNVSELLFHPANFMNGDLDDLTDDKDMEKEHFRYFFCLHLDQLLFVYF